MTWCGYVLNFPAAHEILAEPLLQCEVYILMDYMTFLMFLLLYFVSRYFGRQTVRHWNILILMWCHELKKNKPGQD